MNRRTPTWLTYTLCLGLGVVPFAGRAAPGTLPAVPIFLSNSADPNLLVAIDDSDSMDYEVLLPSNDGALWWHNDDASFTSRDANDSSLPGTINFNRNGTSGTTWKTYSYLFPNGYNSSYDGRRLLADASNDHYALPPSDAYAFVRSPDYNTLYYNPDQVYVPWSSNGSYTFTDSPPTAARYDPVYSGAGSLDLTRDFDNTHSNWNQPNWQFKFYAGMVDENNLPVAATHSRSAIYFPATYYRPAGSVDHTGYNASAACATCRAPDGSLMDRYQIQPGNYASTAQYQAAIQNFANWFTYYRRRHQAMRSGIGLAFDSLRATRAGLYTLNNLVNVSMRDLDSSSAKSSFYNSLYTAVGTGNSRNRYALDHAGRQYARTDAGKPVQYSCQQNFALLFTDGYSDDATPMGVDSNYDRTAGAPYEDGNRGTLADIAWRYYSYVGASASGNVPVPAACADPAHDPWLDCNTKLHMNTFAVTLGSKGQVYGETHTTTSEAYTTPPPWQNPTIDQHPHQIDDLYHATINGRGSLLSAASPAQITTQLQATLNSIASHSGTAAALSFSTTSLLSNSVLYQSRFNSSGWSGDLSALRLNADGSIGASKWSAAARLQARGESYYASRKVYSYNDDSGLGIDFTWSALSARQKNDLRTASDGSIEATDSAAQERLLYIKGKRGCERSATSSCSITRSFRNRSGLLGDILGSSAVHVAKPGQTWPDTAPFPQTASYSAFKDAQKNRTPMVYLGANDGMLHAFNANSGDEVYSYIPNALFQSATTGSGLHYLTENDYDHQYYVDATPTVTDAYLGGAWKTVLVGGLNGGGRGVYALDITHPDAPSASGVMWEFSHPDLGYTYGQPVVVPLGTGSDIEWYVIVANGYNDASGGPHDGEAQLFVLKLAGPGSDKVWDLNSDYYVLTTGVHTHMMDSRNGLSTPEVADYTGDRIADRVYAGDLFGNLWVFDVHGSPAYWKDKSPKRLFTTLGNQAITARPTVAYNPNIATSDTTAPNLLVMFGSGQYLVTADKGTTASQYFYGLWDHYPDTADIPTLGSSDLVAQGPLSTVTSNGKSLRVMGNPASVRYTGTGAKQGWYLPLPDSGERVVNPALALGNVVYFTTAVPSGNACDVGGRGWMMALDVATGARTTLSVFDINRDRTINQSDKVSSGGSPTVVSGQAIDTGLPQAAAALGGNLYSADNNGNLQVSRANTGGNERGLRRQSWRQIFVEGLN